MNTGSATAAASTARKETGEFNHKATYAMTKRGIFRDDVIGEVLGVSERTARHYKSEPCVAYMVELRQTLERQERENANRSSKPFILDFVSTPEVAAGWRSNGLRGEIGELLRQGLSQSDVARYLGISRQLVSYHAKAT